MPISDEVIELAPVKKTKSALIGMIIGMVALFAAAAAFLVMYLLKPSVTEDKNHVKDVSTNATGLFSMVENGQEVLYASVGNEYIVYSTVTVDNDTATTVRWDVDTTLLLVKEETNNVTKDADGNNIPAYVKFVPRDNAGGKTAKIVARSSVSPNEFMTVEFKVVNQGTEDIEVTQYGASGSWTNLSDDSISKDLELTIPYYSNATGGISSNNKPTIVRFKQHGKYNPTSREHSKITEIDVNGKKSNVVEITSSNNDVITVNQDPAATAEFSFTAKKKGEATITIKANVNNDSAEITKTIKVKVESNVDLDYVDSIYFFNKPVITTEFLDSVKKDSTTVDSAKIKAAVSAENSGLQVLEYNDDTVKAVVAKNFALILPYSNSNSTTYNNIFDHILLNPLNIQYSGTAIGTAWHKNIDVASSDKNIVEVTTDSDGGVKLYPKALGSCTLTFKDKKSGSAGASLSVPVRVVAQTTKMALGVQGITGGTETAKEIPATTNQKYTVTATYTFTAPAATSTSSWLDDGYINNKYSLEFNESELSVTLKDKTDLLKSGTVYSGVYTIEKGSGTGATTTYTAVLTFEVTVKKTGDGSTPFKIIKSASDLASGDLASKDGAFELTATFTITEKATDAWVSDDIDAMRDIVTDGGKHAGNYVRNSATKASLYVQNQASGVLEIVTEENLPRFVKTNNNTYFTLKKENILGSHSQSSVIRFNNNSKTFTFQGGTATKAIAGNISFEVFDVEGKSVKTLSLDIYVINAITEITVKNTTKPDVTYNASANAQPVVIQDSDIVASYEFGADANYTEYDDIELYYKSSIPFAKGKKQGNEKILTFSYEEDGDVLYEFNTETKQLTVVADVYKYSYREGIDFGSVAIRVLIGSRDEYIGKHYDGEFNAYSGKMSVNFVRSADGAALYKSDYSSSPIELAVNREETGESGAVFAVPVNHGGYSWIYVSSVIDIGGEKVYVKANPLGDITKVEDAYFILPAEITSVRNKELVSGFTDRYYNAEIYVQEITEPQKPFKTNSSVVWKNGSGGSAKLVIVVNNQMRSIKSIGIYAEDPDENEHAEQVSSLTFGKFIGGTGTYSHKLYIKVTYDAYNEHYTTVEDAVFTWPSYLKVTEAPNAVDYKYLLSVEVDTLGEETEKVYELTVSLVEHTDITAEHTISVVPSEHTLDGKDVSCDIVVRAGLQTLKVYENDGEEAIASIQAGQTILPITRNLTLTSSSSEPFIKLSFGYGIIDGDIYNTVYAHTQNGLGIECSSDISGFSRENNIKGAASTYLIKVIPTAIQTNTYTFTFKFTDTFGGASANNVFSFTLHITVVADLYALAFDDSSSQYDATVTGASSGSQQLTVNVKYNDGEDRLQPTKSDVLYVYTSEDEQAFTAYTGGAIRVANNNGVYTVTIDNNVDLTKTYYLVLLHKVGDEVKVGGTTDKAKYVRKLTLNTLSSHLEFRASNDVKPQDESASITIYTADDTYKLIADVVNDGSGALESGKTATYGLYTSRAYNAPAVGFKIEEGIISVVPDALNQISGTIYYRAQYTDSVTSTLYELEVAISFTVAPASVEIGDVDADLLSSNRLGIILEYGCGGYTYADLTGKLVAKTAFANAIYSTENIEYGIELTYPAQDGEYLEVSGLTLIPKKAHRSEHGDGVGVRIKITAKYAGFTVEKDIAVLIRAIPELTFDSDEGTLSMLDSSAELTVTPVFQKFGFTHTFSLSDADGMFTVTEDGEEGSDAVIVKIASGAAIKAKEYELTATLTLSYSGGSCKMQAGTIKSTAVYTVTVTADAVPEFALTSNGSPISCYDGSDGTKYAIVDNSSATYGITITNDPGLADIRYSAVSTGVIVIQENAFGNGKTATVTLANNASGAFSITVTATIGGEKLIGKQNYYFIYGADISAALSVSTDGGSQYDAFSDSTKTIDYTDQPYMFKYELSGLPDDALVDVTVQGDFAQGDVVKDSAISGGKYKVVITAKKPTTLLIGGTVKIGNRTIYLTEKKVTLTATAPNFEWSNDTAEMMPGEEQTFKLENKATGFMGTVSVEYKLNSTTFATIGRTDGKLKANSDVLTDQTVIITATVNVAGGVYAGEYTFTKAVIIKGVSLPTISWKETANKTLCWSENNKEHNYSSSDYTFTDKVNNDAYDYNGKVSFTLSAVGGAGLTAADFEITDFKLALKETANVKAGGTILLTITATINSGAHAGETVSDVITVRVLPIMNETESSVKLGNAQGSYDLNGDRFKSTFAPCGIGSDTYRITSLSVSNSEYFEVDGTRLLLKNNLPSSVSSVNVTATVLITSGAFAGVELTGTKAIGFLFPNTVDTHNFVYSTDTQAYATLTLDKEKVVGSVLGEVQGIEVLIPTEMLGYISVADDGLAAPVITLNKDYGAYLTSGAGSKSFTLSYVVTVSDNGIEYVYYKTVNYTADTFKVTVTAKVGEEPVTSSSPAMIDSGNTALVNLTADNGYSVIITGASVTTGSGYLTATWGGNGVQLSAEEVTTDQNVTVVLNITVGGVTDEFTLYVKVMAPQADSQYSVTATDNIFALNEGDNSAVDVRSDWDITTFNYKYLYSIVVTAPTGDNLSKYIKSVSLNGSLNTIPSTGSSATLYFNNRQHSASANTFYLNIKFNTNVAFATSTISVQYVGYNRAMGGSYSSITTKYTTRVIGEIAVTLDYNAGDDTVTANGSEDYRYTNPMYKGQYNLPDLTRKGYTFDGWYTAVTDGNQVQKDATVTMTAAHTLYAHWTARKYTLKYNANYPQAPSIADKTEQVTYGQPYGELNTPTRDGYDFVGWTIGSASTTELVTSTSLVMPANDTASDITLYAQWRVKYFTVTIDADGGYLYGTTDKLEIEVAYGCTFTMHAAIVPTRTGYRFDHWDKDNSVTVTAAVTIKAVWKQLYTVTLNWNYVDAPNSGTFATLQYAFAEGDKLDNLPTPAREGYSFDGWFPSENSGEAVTSETEFANGTHNTLYAHWTAIPTFTVTLNASGGMIGEQETYTVTLNQGETYSDYSIIVPTRDNYRFDGWYTKAQGVDDGGTKQTGAISSTTTLYAHWTQVVFTVKLHVDNGQTLEFKVSSVSELSSLLATINPSAPEGKQFGGWYTGSSDSGEQWNAPESLTGDVELYAHFTDIQATDPDTGDNGETGEQDTESEHQENN
ncbi:MAG: InlB B-repeat-containing protein [Clostridiales bacterium]|nr:InlB B-repeat-containing protein [Clostridiales bacterium]